MFLVETLAGFDVLALGVIVGSAGLVAGLLWVLIDNRQFEGFKPAANRFREGTGGLTSDAAHSATEHPSAAEPRSPRSPRAA